MISVYKQYSEWISTSTRQGGIPDSLIRPMKALRRDILSLISTYLESETNFDYFNANFLPTLQAMVEDYQTSDPFARDPQTLMFFATLLKKEGQHLTNILNQLLVGLCQPTLDMIKDDFITFPEFREGFMTLVHNMIKYCTSALIELDPGMFSTII
jgi:exportin-1